MARKRKAGNGYVCRKKINGKWAMIYRRSGNQGYVANIVKNPRRRRARRR